MDSYYFIIWWLKTTLEYQIEGHARLFIFKNLSSVSTDFNVVKYFFHPTRLFIYYIKKQGFSTLPVYYILPVYSIGESRYVCSSFPTFSAKYTNITKWSFS